MLQKMEQRSGAAAAVIFWVISFVAWMETRNFPSGFAMNEELGMDFFPRFCIYAISGLSLLLFIHSLLFPLKEKELPKSLTSTGKSRLLIVLSVMLAYTLTYEWVGFYIGSYLFSLIFLYTLGERRALTLFLYPAVLVSIAYVGFVQILKVMLPKGEILYMLLY